jgi:hypothetical protein
VRTGAALVMGLPVPQSRRTYEGRLFPPIAPPSTGDFEADVLALTARHAAVLEDWIRAHPEQWLWTHRRWKTAPASAPSRPALVPALLAVLLAALAAARGPGARPAAVAPADSLAHADSLLPGDVESAFDGAGSSVFPLSEARVRRVFEDVRIRRTEKGWDIDAEEIFQAGVAPARAAMGLPDYRASVGPDSASHSTRGTVKDLSSPSTACRWA